MTEEHRKEQIKKAQSKYKKIGTNVKLEFAEQIKKRCDDKGVTVSRYVLNLINDDMNQTNEESIKLQNKIDNYALAMNRLKEGLNRYENRTPLQEILSGLKRLLKTK